MDISCRKQAQDLLHQSMPKCTEPNWTTWWKSSIRIQFICNLWLTLPNSLSMKWLLPELFSSPVYPFSRQSLSPQLCSSLTSNWVMWRVNRQRCVKRCHAVTGFALSLNLHCPATAHSITSLQSTLCFQQSLYGTFVFWQILSLLRV